MPFRSTVILFSVTLFFVTNIYAQDEPDAPKYKNEIGIVLTDLIDASYQLKYERLLGKHFSVALGVALKGEEGLINLSGLKTEKLRTGGISYSGYKIVPEVRYYINNTQQYLMDGFYFGAYLKYSNFSSDLDGTYIDDAGENFTIAFDADLNVTSAGFMAGYKLAISKRFSIDFLIAGPGAGFYSFSLKNTEDLPDEFYEDLNEALEQYSIFDFLDGDFRFSSTSGSSKFALPTFRYGISLGFSF